VLLSGGLEQSTDGFWCFGDIIKLADVLSKVPKHIISPREIIIHRILMPDPVMYGALGETIEEIHLIVPE
jgi:hypothetical protein